MNECRCVKFVSVEFWSGASRRMNADLALRIASVVRFRCALNAVQSSGERDLR